MRKCACRERRGGLAHAQPVRYFASSAYQSRSQTLRPGRAIKSKYDSEVTLPSHEGIIAVAAAQYPSAFCAQSSMSLAFSAAASASAFFFAASDEAILACSSAKSS